MVAVGYEQMFGNDYFAGINSERRFDKGRRHLAEAENLLKTELCLWKTKDPSPFLV